MGWLARRPTRPAVLLVVALVGFALVLGCATLSGELLGLVQRRDGSTAVDSSITSWVVAHRAHGVTTAARLLSTLGSQAVLLPVTAVVTVILVVRREFVPAGLLVAAWGGAIGLYNLTKHFVHRMRPPVDIRLVSVGRTWSFPSGHATQSLATLFALALVVALWRRKTRWPGRAIALVLATGIGWSRVYLGVHWATDVGAGWLIALAWVAIVAWLAGRGTSDREADAR